MNSELRYPESVSRFRCPVCDTVNDLKPHIRQQLSNEPLTLKRLKRCVSKCSSKERAIRKERMAAGEPAETAISQKELEKFYEPVEELAQTVFGSWVCLNHSFLNVRNKVGSWDTNVLMITIFDHDCRVRRHLWIIAD